MRFKNLCIRIRPVDLITSQPFSFDWHKYGWSISLIMLGVSWFNYKAFDDDFNEIFKGFGQ